MSPSKESHLIEGVAFVKNIPVTVTCTKISLSKTRKSIPQRLVPLKYFILYIYVVLRLLYT